MSKRAAEEGSVVKGGESKKSKRQKPFNSTSTTTSTTTTTTTTTDVPKTNLDPTSEEFSTGADVLRHCLDQAEEMEKEWKGLLNILDPADWFHRDALQRAIDCLASDINDELHGGATGESLVRESETRAREARTGRKWDRS
jgi:hypothetical protein